EVVTIALKAWIVLNVEEDVNVAARGSTNARIPNATQRHVLTRRDARRNLHDDLVIRPHLSLATTLLARRLDDATFPATRRTRADRNDLAEERPLRPSHFAEPVACRALVRLGAWLGAFAIATIAWVEQFDDDFLLDAGDDVRERERDIDLDV